MVTPSMLPPHVYIILSEHALSDTATSALQWHQQRIALLSDTVAFGDCLESQDYMERQHDIPHLALFSSVPSVLPNGWPC